MFGRAFSLVLILALVTGCSAVCQGKDETCQYDYECCGAKICKDGGTRAGTCRSPSTCAASKIEWKQDEKLVVLTGGNNCKVTLADIRDKTGGVAVSNDGDVWTLHHSIVIESPSMVLKVQGGLTTDSVEQLLLESGPSGSVSIIASPGKISILETDITSYDPETNGPDTRLAGRAYIAALSYMEGDVCMASRMDIIKSEISFVGNEGDYHNDINNDYGVVWKVEGFDDRDPYPYDPDDLALFDKCGVYGELKKSNLHDNYMGAYCYGMKGESVWKTNDVHDNYLNGLNPQDNSDYMTLKKNKVYNNGWHGIEYSKRCLGAVVHGNTVENNARAGIFFHRSVDNAVAYDNICRGNEEGDFGIVESNGVEIYNNIMEGGRYGVRLSLGAADNVVRNNKMTNNERYGVFFYMGSDDPQASLSYGGRPRNNLIVENTIDGPLEGQGIACKESDGDEFRDNTFLNIESMRFDASTETLVVGNSFEDGVVFRLENGATLAEGSQSEP